MHGYKKTYTFLYTWKKTTTNGTYILKSIYLMILLDYGLTNKNLRNL